MRKKAKKAAKAAVGFVDRNKEEFGIGLLVAVAILIIWTASC